MLYVSHVGIGFCCGSLGKYQSVFKASTSFSLKFIIQTSKINMIINLKKELVGLIFKCEKGVSSSPIQ